MNALGLICEYNPFHNGHLLHINESKKITSSTDTVVVMSGNYVQRGEPAIVDKQARTKMALLNGADIVIELPLHFATSSAESFSFGAIKILNDCGIVSKVCFGSECNDINLLKKISSTLFSESDEFKSALKHNLSKGLTYPLARQNALTCFLDVDKKVLSSPNNILAIEYLKALEKLNSKIKPYCLKRSNDHNCKHITSNITSATSIRSSLKENGLISIKNTLPKSSFDILEQEIHKGLCPSSLNNLSHILHFILRTQPLEYLSSILDITEGLENRIVKSSNSTFYIDDLLKNIKTKRYTYTKLQRALLHIILDIKKQDFDKCNALGPSYIRVLGFNKEKEYLLKNLKDNSSLPIITNLKNAYKVLNPYQLSILQKEIVSTDIYYLSKNSFSSFPTEKNIEYKLPLVIV
jgi:predicted nucleotidyltransferase